MLPHGPTQFVKWMNENEYKRFFFFFWFPTVFPQDFQPETNHCSCRVSPRRGKALAKEIIFKVQVAGLELGSTPSRAKYKHFETKSSTNLANLLGYYVR